MFRRTLLVLSIAAAACAAHAEKPKTVSLTELGTYASGVFDESAAEIVAYDAASENLFVINAAASVVEVINISDPSTPTKISVINVGPDIAATFLGSESGGVNSVAVRDGLVAIAVENEDTQANGWAAFYDTAGTFLGAVEVGALPDSIAITNNGQYTLVANEGEPSGDYSTDPEGSVSVVDLRKGVARATVRTAGFDGFKLADAQAAGVRVPRAAEEPPAATVAQDLEPEFIVASNDSKTAWVTLQENNAIAIVDIRSATVTGLVGLGSKDHALPGNELDASDRDDAINITNWPVRGLYMPDGIDTYKVRGRSYLVTAGEGDAREYFFDIEETDLLEDESKEDACDRLGGLDYDEDDGCLSYVDEADIDEVTLDPVAFPEADELQQEEKIGRLALVTTEGDTDGDGDYDELFIFGSRSITIWDANGDFVADTGATIEGEMAAETIFCAGDLKDCSGFNSDNDENDSFDSRSDAKGPEPEGVVVGKVRGDYFAFVGLERVGGIMVFNVTDPTDPTYVGYTNNRDFNPDLDVEEGGAGDLGPEGLVFIKAEDSPTGDPLLVVGNEVSGTTTVYRITD